MDTEWTCFGYYLMFHSMFHFSEFVSISIVNPISLTTNSFLFTHSKLLVMSTIMSWIEYFIEIYSVNHIKQLILIRNAGIILCLIGESIRKTAIKTCGVNFDHNLRTKSNVNHQNNQQLIKHGIYKLCRHPSYLGCFIWVIGTQLILVNPLSLIMFIIVSWTFFRNRIKDEEVNLINIYGQEYVLYMKNVRSGIPFVN